jgi:hypothetical protein
VESAAAERRVVGGIVDGAEPSPGPVVEAAIRIRRTAMLATLARKEESAELSRNETARF